MKLTYGLTGHRNRKISGQVSCRFEGSWRTPPRPRLERHGRQYQGSR